MYRYIYIYYILQGLGPAIYRVRFTYIDIYIYIWNIRFRAFYSVYIYIPYC